ncbi:HEBP1 protein, partial [Atractosteus spatula]|nr:HEBP1 protein [Atractosteus spatula]
MLGMIRNSLFGQHEETPYKLLSSETKDGVSYEVRRYEGGRFASVESEGRGFDEVAGESMKKLLKYVGGSNDRGQGLGMTAPVCITAFLRDDGSWTRRFIFGLRVPSGFQESPPVPTETGVRIDDRPGMTVYALQFGGFAKEVDYRTQAARLATALGDSAPYQRGLYLCCGYDPPMKPYGRRNEVWFLQEEP